MSAAALLAATLAAATLHVDLASAPGGDGSAERPFTHVADALAVAPDGATLTLETGLYEEALVVTRAVELVGVGSRVVLAAPPGSAAAIAIDAPTTLRNLGIQGGRIGVAVRSSGEARLTRVALRGQPDIAIDCGRRPCSLTEVQAEASFASAVGVRAAGTLELHGCLFTGPFKRALEVTAGARVRGEGVTAVGATTGLHALNADVELADLHVEGARQVAVFASGGQVHLVEPVLARCGYGILARDQARAVVRGAIVTGCADAALASTQADIDVADWVSVGPARDAAMTFDGGRAHVVGALLLTPGPAGVRAHRARLELDHVTVVGAAVEGGTFGNALFLQDTEAQVADLDGERLEGPAVEAQLGTGQIRGLTVVGGPAAVAWEFQAHLDVAGLLQHGGSGTGLACIEGGQGRVRAPRFEGLAQAPWLIDCSCRIQVSPPPVGFPTCAAGTPAPLPPRTIRPLRP